MLGTPILRQARSRRVGLIGLRRGGPRRLLPWGSFQAGDSNLGG